MTIYDLVQAREIGIYWETLSQDREPYMFEAKFPNVKQLGLDLSYIKGSSGLPVVLNVSAFDVQVIPRNRIGFERLEAEMPFFKESLTVDEKTRQELNIVLQTGNQAYIEAILNKIFADITTLLEAAAAARERMRTLAVTTGVVSLAANGQEYNYNYQIPNGHKFTEQNFNDADFDICAYINGCLDVIEDDTGVRPTEGVISRNQMSKILANNILKKNIYVLTNGTGTINQQNALTYIQDQTGVKLVVYTKRYKYNGSTHRYIPDDTVVLYPEGTLGETHFGTTPEESDLMSGSAANVYITDTGVAITTMKREDPVNVETKVSQICLPSFEAANQVAIIDTSST